VDRAVNSFCRSAASREPHTDELFPRWRTLIAKEPIPLSNVRSCNNILTFEALLMNALPESILQHAQSLPEGGVLSPKAFLHLGSRAAIDQALSRLTKEGKLLRVARGIYVAPISSRFGVRAPAPERVVAAMASQSGDVVAPHGATAAHALGLTQQVPIREVYVTSGRTRRLKLGHSEVLVRHVPGWMLALGNRPAGAAVRALQWMGKTHVGESLGILRRTLPPSKWNALASSRAALPSWMARAIGEETTRS